MLASKKAVPAGTVAGVQLVAVLKSRLPGSSSQVAFCAAAGDTAATLPPNAAEASSAHRGLE